MAVHRCCSEVISPVIASLHGLCGVVQQSQRRQMSDWRHRIHVLVCPSLGRLATVCRSQISTGSCTLLGESRTRYLMLTAEFLEVESLTTSGFVSEVLESAALCDQRARDLAVHMTTLAPLTISATRDGLARLEERPVPADSDLIQRCYLSDDFSEGVDAFFAKRKPTWSGQ